MNHRLMIYTDLYSHELLYLSIDEFEHEHRYHMIDYNSTIHSMGANEDQ